MKKLLLLLSILLLVGCTNLDQATYSDSYLEINDLGMEAMNSGHIEEAVKYFTKLTQMDDTKAIGYNNLGWALNDLGDFEKAVEALKQSIAIDPKYSYAYSNLGNAYSALEQDDLAEEAYINAVAFDRENSYAYYGLAVIYDLAGDYDLAIENYDLSINYMPDDVDTVYDKLYLMYEYGHYKDALYYIDDIIDTYNTYLLHEIKGLMLEELETEAVIIEYYSDLHEKFPDEVNTTLNLGVYYFYREDYNKALKAFHAYDNNEDNLNWIAYIYYLQGDYENGEKYALQLVRQYPDYYLGFETLADIYYEQTDYFKAIDAYEEAYNISGLPEYAHSVAYTYIDLQRYSRAIELSKAYLKNHPDYQDLLSDIAFAYYSMNDYENALIYLNQMNELMYDVDLEYYMAESYMNLDDYDQALEHINLYLDAYPDNTYALDIKDTLSNSSQLSLDKIQGYFDDYYLYQYNQDTFSAFEDPLNDQEVYKLIESAKETADPYTFVLTGEDYDYVQDESNNPLIIEVVDDRVYITFSRFDYSIDHLFIEAIDSIQNSEQTDLIIDLRYNTGGSTDSATNILNALLPDVLISQFIYKDGSSYPIYSDKSYVPFEDIYVLTSNYTASASEMVALGLKTYLDNVTIIGDTTYGKGVGQDTFNDPINNRLYCIVSHYWNVRQSNINEVGIEPDIYVVSDDLLDYLDAIE